MTRGIRTACVYVPKGGVGKSTTAAHMAVTAATDHELDVVLIDIAGTQNDLAKQFGVSKPVADLLQSDDGVPVSAVFRDEWQLIHDNIPDVVDRMTVETGEGPDLIPANPGLGGADNQLANIAQEERYNRLESFVRETLAEHYDFALLDLPGTENNIAINGLVAAGSVVAPIRPGAFERNQLDSLETEDLAVIRDAYDIDLELVMVMPTMINQAIKQHRDFPDALAEAYPDAIAPMPVASSQNIPNQQELGRTIFAMDLDDLYETGHRAMEAYRTNTTELLTRLDGTHD